MLKVMEKWKRDIFFLVKSITESRIESINTESSEDFRKLSRHFHCVTPNCMISIISCIQNIEKLYDHFIFKNVSIWELVIDTSKMIHFEMEQDQMRSRRRQLATMRQNTQKTVFQSPKYIQSHYLSDSSQDIGHYDFTSSLSEGLSDAAVAARMNEKLSATSCHFVQLEGEELDNHPCLAQLVAVVKHMESKHMYTVPTDCYGNADPPLWMKSILAVLESEEHHRNIKLFLLKIILTVPDIFAPFAKIFQLPILNIIGDGVLTDSGNSINYFTSDLIIMLLSWSKQTGIVPERQDILRHNLELLKSVL